MFKSLPIKCVLNRNPIGVVKNFSTLDNHCVLGSVLVRSDNNDCPFGGINHLQKRWNRDRPPFARRMKGKKIKLRKPIWFPTAPSKLFEIREPIHFEPHEEEQLDVLHFNYKNGLRSLQAYLHEHIYMATITAKGFTPEQVREEEEEQRRLIEENRMENMRQKELREKMTEEFKEEIEHKAFEKEMERLVLNEMEIKEIEKQVEIEIERSKSFITKDNLDEAIEFALNNPVNYEFAIDLRGKTIGATHPYALKPHDIPDSSGLEQFAEKQPTSA
ncbi:mitochondrial ribosomal protein S26 [Brevipalpus obovatus]|uniref:mitochondrial ribosomal protein S26 n=1 Tax=Brevipalpus obovatus TaxID=246614 RepID=UPI003D9F5DFA